MESAFLSSVVQLGVGGLSVGGLIYVTLKFLDKLEAMHKRHIEAQEAMSRRYLEAQQENAKRHEASMREQEGKLRDVETHVRETLTASLTQNTIALTDAARVLGRVTSRLDSSK